MVVIVIIVVVKLNKGTLHPHAVFLTEILTLLEFLRYPTEIEQEIAVKHPDVLLIHRLELAGEVATRPLLCRQQRQR